MIDIDMSVPSAGLHHCCLKLRIVDLITAVVDDKAELLMPVVIVNVSVCRDIYVNANSRFDDGEACLCHRIVFAVFKDVHYIVARD